MPTYYAGGDLSKEQLDTIAKNLMDWVQDNIVSHKEFLLGDFALPNGIRPKVIADLARQHEGIKEAYLWAKEWQEHMWIKGAAYGKVHPRFAEFMLSCNHNYRPEQSKDNQEKMVSFFEAFTEQIRCNEAQYVSNQAKPRISQGNSSCVGFDE